MPTAAMDWTVSHCHSVLTHHHHHHHHRFYVCFSTLAQVRRFPINSSPPGHPILCIFFSQLKLSHILNYTLMPCFSASRSEEHTSELQSHSDLVCRLLLENKSSDALLQGQHDS